MKKILLGVFLTLFVILSFWLFNYFYSNSTTSEVVYETTKPFRTDIVKKAVATGSIKPRKEVLIKSQVSGIIDELFVEPGNTVKKGDPIARIKLVPSPTALNSAKSNVDLAKLRYEDAKRQLEQQKKIFDNKYDKEQARVRYETAVREEARYRKLFNDGVIPEQEYEKYQRELTIAQNDLNTADLASVSNLNEFQAAVDIRHQELDAGISNLQLLQKGVANKSGQVSNVVKATVDGMVLDVPVEVGTSVIERNNFNEGTTIAEIADMQKLIFEGLVDESDVGKLREGLTLELTVGALENEKFEAILEYIAPKGITESGSVKFKIKAAVKPKGGTFLRAGYSANGDIILAQKEQVLAIQERDLQFTKDEQPYVEISTGNQQFEQRMVKVGLSDGINIEVLDGLSESEAIKVVQKGE
ncbi:MAG: HlyD family efflux transporter periplasmic adaptor subunit [Aureispira sp.]|nr:HlyD family efflux transporter periplasmic adaptor subunit [Aureispira sp.]